MVISSRRRQCGGCGQWFQLQQPLLNVHACTQLLVAAQMLVILIQAIEDDQKHIEDQLHQAQAHWPYLMKWRHRFSTSFSIIMYQYILADCLMGICSKFSNQRQCGCCGQWFTL